MAQIINTNVMSLNAQRNLNNTATGLSTALQRLSSGLRVNSSMDDAAGLAVAYLGGYLITLMFGCKNVDLS